MASSIRLKLLHHKPWPGALDASTGKAGGWLLMGLMADDAAVLLIYMWVVMSGRPTSTKRDEHRSHRWWPAPGPGAWNHESQQGVGFGA